MSRSDLKQLFEKLGEKKLAEILRDFYLKMSNDTMVGYFFAGKNPNEIADKQLQFLKFAMGVSPTYSGKTPTTAHLGLPPIFSGHFDRRLVLLRETLSQHQVADEDIRTWINFENAFRDLLVTR